MGIRRRIQRRFRIRTGDTELYADWNADSDADTVRNGWKMVNRFKQYNWNTSLEYIDDGRSQKRKRDIETCKY